MIPGLDSSPMLNRGDNLEEHAEGHDNGIVLSAVPDLEGRSILSDDAARAGDLQGVPETQIEESADPIEQFTPAEDVLDPVEQFSLDAGVEFSADAIDADLFGQFDEKVFDDGFTSVSEAASVNETFGHESFSSGDCNHAATQRAFAQSLEPQMPQYMWEQAGFLNAVFGDGDIVKTCFRSSL